MKMLYILKGKIPVLAGNVEEWSEWLSTYDRTVAITNIADPEGNLILVSTVFLGIDHDYGFGYEPVLFETMIFGGEHDGYQRRYKTWAEAEAGHEETVYRVTHVNTE